MQAFIQQLSDPAESRVPVQCKELGQLIRQLSLCSAKVEVGQGSAVPETTLDILQKLEVMTDFMYCDFFPLNSPLGCLIDILDLIALKGAVWNLFLAISTKMLDLALSKQDSHQEQESRMRSISPIRERTSRVSGRSKSLNRFPRAQTAKATRRPKKSTAPKKSKLSSL